MDNAPDDTAVIESVINYSLYDYSHIANSFGSRLTWSTRDIDWVKGNSGCIHFFAFLRLYSDFDDTQFLITLQYKKANGEVREVELWNARYYVAQLGMVFYEEYPISLTIDAPRSDEDIVSVRFDQFNGDNFAFFKDPQALSRFSLNKFGQCGEVTCGPLFLGYEQYEQTKMSSNCGSGSEGDQCLMLCDSSEEKSSSQARCKVDGRWHQPSFDERNDPNAAIFPHCVPKECAAGINLEIANGKITCDEKGKVFDGNFIGQIGAKCSVECDDKYQLSYTADATAWDKQKPLHAEIECLFSQKYYAINGGMYFDVINWSGSTKLACVHENPARSSRTRQRISPPQSRGCWNNPVNGILICDDKVAIDSSMVPFGQSCQIKCFDGFSVEDEDVTCTYSGHYGGSYPLQWSSSINCQKY